MLLRPAVSIFAATLRKVILIELTCGNEENFEDKKLLIREEIRTATARY